MKRNHKKGFTIVELVIVIAVIAILAAVLIPTFSGLIEKANMSVDMQIVNQMNTALHAEEIVDGKPATVVDAKAILVANGCDDFTPADSKNVFYWVGSENRVILWEKDEGDGVTTGKVTYPKEYAEKYASLTTASNDWADLAGSYNVQVLTPEEGETLRTTLLEAVDEAADGAILQIPAGETVNLGAGGLYFLGSYMENAGGTGKTLTIDLNGGTIDSLTAHSNGYYYGGYVPASGSLTLVNGTINVAGYVNAFDVESGAHLILRDIELNVPGGDAIFPAGDASEVVLEDCKIVAGANYGIATNNQMSDNIHIKISNTTLEAPSCALLVNVPCDVMVKDSTVIGGGWGAIVRSGHAVFENTTIKTTDGDVGADDSRYNTSCEYFAYNATASNLPYWGEGAQVPYAPLIVGDYSSHNAYNHDTDVTLTNVKLVNANTATIPDIVVAARPTGKDVVVNYDAATTVGKLTVYGEGYVRTSVNSTAINHIFKHKGTITVNGTEKTYNGVVGTPDEYTLVEYGTADRYTISTSVGDFPGYQWFDISVLQGAELEAFKAHFTAKGLDLTDAQWATVKFAAGGTANVIKSIKYIE